MRKAFAITFVLVVYFVAGCSEPNKGNSYIEFSVDSAGARVNCPYGAVFVVPEDATQNCTVKLVFANTPPKSVANAEQISFCAHVNLSCKEFAKPATLLFPLWRSIEQTEVSSVKGAFMADNKSDVALTSADVPNENSALVEVIKSGFYWVVVKGKNER